MPTFSLRFSPLLIALCLLPCLFMGRAGAQTITLTPSTIPSGHVGRIVNVVLTPGGADTTLVGKTFTVTNNTGFPNNTTVTVTGQSVTDATHATVTVTTGAGGGPASLSDGTTSANLTQRIVFIRTSPTYVAPNTTTTITVNEVNTLGLTDSPQMSVSGVAGASAGTSAWATDTQGTFSLTTGAAAGNLTVTDPATGAATKIVVGTPAQRIYIPYFTSLTGLTSPTGLSVASNGGLVATTAGTAGTATIPLPEYIDLNLPFRFGVLVEYNGDTSNQCNVNLLGTGANSNQTVLGGVVSTYVSPTGGSSTMPAISGQRYWIYLSSAGLNVGGGLINAVAPAYDAGFNTTVVGPGTAQFNYINSYIFGFTPYPTYLGTSYENLPTCGIGSVTISNASATTRILGILVQQGSLAGGTDPQCQPPGLIGMTVNGDTTAGVAICPQYDGVTPTPLLIVAHPNGSNEFTGLLNFYTDTGAALALVRRGGYNEAWMRATTDTSGNTYSNPPASGWGSNAQEVFWKALIDFNKSALPTTGKVFWVGQSMGGVTGLRFHMKYPGTLSGLYGISAVTNLAYSYSINEGFNPIIDQAYGTSGTFITGGSAATFDPNLNPAAFAGANILPCRFFHGAADSLIHKANHCDLFATNVNALGGKVSTVAIPGAGHLDKIALYDGADMLKFFNALNAPPAGGTKRKTQ